MKKFIAIFLLIPALVFADAVIFSGNDVKALKQNLDLFGVAKIMSGTLDPSAGGGVAAPQGSIYLSTTVGTYEKTGPLATDWTKFGLLPIDLVTDVTGILPVANGGTGLDGSSAANGSLLIGNGTGYTLSTVTGTANQVSVTNGAGSITLSLPQDIATSSDPSFNSVTVTDTDFGTMNLGQTIARAASTGVLTTGGLSIDTDPSKFDLGLTVITVVDNTDAVNPIRQSASCGPFDAQTLTNLGTQPVTYISLDASCNIIQTPDYPTPDERRQYAFVGRVNHSNLTTISFTNTIPDLIISPIAQTYDLFDALGPFNISGNLISPNGANLSFNKSAGEVFQRSNHYLTDNQNPHFNITPGLIAAPFRYTTQTTTAGADVTVIDPTNYDVGGTITAVPNPVQTATVQRVYLFGSNNLRVLYGQATYANLAAAVQGFQTENFVVNPAVEGFSVLIAFIAIQKNCTSLQDTTCAKIMLAPRFAQGAGGGGGGGGTTTLQQAYLNSVQPQIVLNSTQSGMQVRDASTPIGSSLFAIQDNAGTTSYLGVSAAAGLGTIGVNVSSPSATAHLHNTGAAANSLKVTNSATGTGASDGVNVGVTATGEAQVYNFENTALNFATNNTQRAQISAGGSMAIGASAPTTSAKLDIQGTDGALLLPRLSTTQKNALTPTAGMQVYDTTIGDVSYYNGSWVSSLTNPMTTGGDTIYGGSGGTPTRLPNGTANQLLSSTGGTSAPVWKSLSTVPGSTTSNATGSERIERFRANCSSTSSITSQSGSFASSIGNISSGSCVVTISSPFSGAAADLSCEGNSVGGTPVVIGIDPTSTSSVTVSCISDDGVACSNYNFSMICMGPR